MSSEAEGTAIQMEPPSDFGKRDDSVPERRCIAPQQVQALHGPIESPGRLAARASRSKICTATYRTFCAPAQAERICRSSATSKSHRSGGRDRGESFFTSPSRAPGAHPTVRKGQLKWMEPFPRSRSAIGTCLPGPGYCRSRIASHTALCDELQVIKLFTPRVSPLIMGN